VNGAARRSSGAETQRRHFRRRLAVATIVLAMAIAALFLVMCPGRVHGQMVRDLTGTWVLNIAKSDFGGVPGPKSDTWVVTRDGFTYHIKQSADQGQGPVEIHTDWPTDSGDVTNKLPNGMTMAVKAHREGPAQVFTIAISMSGQTASESGRQLLSDDGRTLTRYMTVNPVGGDSINIRLVYDKKVN
jgi:hypothetical protein